MRWVQSFVVPKRAPDKLSFSRGSLAHRRTEGTKALCRLPIHKCAEYGSEDCLQVLLKAGADPRLEDVSESGGGWYKGSITWLASAAKPSYFSITC